MTNRDYGTLPLGEGVIPNAERQPRRWVAAAPHSSSYSSYSYFHVLILTSLGARRRLRLLAGGGALLVLGVALVTIASFAARPTELMVLPEHTSR